MAPTPPMRRQTVLRSARRTPTTRSPADALAPTPRPFTLSANATDGKNPLFPVTFTAPGSCTSEELFTSLPSGVWGVAGLLSGGGAGVAIFDGGPFHLLATPPVEVAEDLWNNQPSFLTNPKNGAYYFRITGISVNNEPVAIPPGAFDLDFGTGTGGVMFSTVTPYTTMRSDIYRPLLEAFDAATSSIPRAPPVRLFDMCYRVSALSMTRLGFAVANIDLFLDGGQRWMLPGGCCRVVALWCRFRLVRHQAAANGDSAIAHKARKATECIRTLLDNGMVTLTKESRKLCHSEVACRCSVEHWRHNCGKVATTMRPSEVDSDDGNVDASPVGESDDGVKLGAPATAHKARKAAECIRKLLNKGMSTDTFLGRLAGEVNKAIEEMVSFHGSLPAFRRAVVSYLREGGYNAAVCQTRWRGTQDVSAGNYEYIDVVTTASGKETAAGERYIVDVGFAMEFSVARSTAVYLMVLEALPTVLVARPKVVQQVVKVAAKAARRSLKSQGLTVPPWRKKRFMAAKWLGPHCRTPDTAMGSCVPSVAAGEAICRIVGFFLAPSEPPCLRYAFH
ncbi:hypothetical protein EJB05_28115, partial [Eragrostis curvula]